MCIRDRLSPVEVSARFIGKFREEWDRAMGAPLAEQDIVLTVPASFDEEARELTVMAARDAGLEKLTLLEEPAAAFYSWIADVYKRQQYRPGSPIADEGRGSDGDPYQQRENRLEIHAG